MWVVAEVYLNQLYLPSVTKAPSKSDDFTRVSVTLGFPSIVTIFNQHSVFCVFLGDSEIF